MCAAVSRFVQLGTKAVSLAVLAIALSLSAAVAQAPLSNKPFAEQRLVLQLSDKAPSKEALVISVAYNLLKYYGPDKIA